MVPKTVCSQDDETNGSVLVVIAGKVQFSVGNDGSGGHVRRCFEQGWRGAHRLFVAEHERFVETLDRI